jgi:molybdenum cofactor cytidylyltransferase
MLNKNQAPVFGIILLAAGVGKRYREEGGKGEKLLASYKDDLGKKVTLIELTLQNSIRAQLPVMVICRPESKALHEVISDYPVETTYFPSMGSGESIAFGVRATASWSGWLITPADMGWIKPQDYLVVKNALESGLHQVRPVWGDHPGHPVGFSAKYRDQLMTLTKDVGAKEILNQDLINISSSQRVVMDADYPICSL